MTITPAQYGFLQALGVVILVSVLSYLGDATHLTGVLNPITASIIAALAASLEAHLKDKSGNTTALFGAVSVR